jgi:hypothetical protein
VTESPENAATRAPGLTAGNMANGLRLISTPRLKEHTEANDEGNDKQPRNDGQEGNQLVMASEKIAKFTLLEDNSLKAT